MKEIIITAVATYILTKLSDKWKPYSHIRAKTDVRKYDRVVLNHLFDIDNEFSITIKGSPLYPEYPNWNSKSGEYVVIGTEA